jgi:hypothetical protein
MERVLAEALRDQRSLGLQSDGVRKAVAYNVAPDVLSARFIVQLTGGNVKTKSSFGEGGMG